MKKKLAAVAAAVIAFSAICGAATPFYKYEGISLRADVRIGANISDMSYLTTGHDSGEFRMDPVRGLNAGAGLTVNILHGVALETGVALVERGGWDKSLLNNKYASTWVEVPLLLTLGFGDADIVRFYVQGGGYGAYGIGGKTVNEVSTYAFFGEEEVATPLDYGLSAGLGIIAVNHLRLGVRYDYGLRNISAGNIKKIASLYNETISLHIGYLF